MSLTLLVGGILASVPVGKLEIFDNWIVGCENEHWACHATTLDPSGVTGRDEAAGVFSARLVGMALHRGAGIHDRPVIWLLPVPHVGPDEQVDYSSLREVVVRSRTGEPQASIILSKEDWSSVLRDGSLTADTSALVVDAMPGGISLDLIGDEGAIASVTLLGAKEAMRHFDVQQYRVGNETALIERGTQPAYLVPPKPPPRPVVIPPSSPLPPAVPLPAAREAVLTEAGFEKQKCPAPELISHRLDSEATLLAVVAACAPYNNSGYIFIVDNDGHTRPAIVRVREDQPALEQPLVGVWWEAERLRSFGRGRALADCGESQAFAWNGKEFLLVRQDQMDACRGSLDYITVYRRPTKEGR